MNLEYLFKILVLYMILSKALEALLSMTNTKLFESRGEKVVKGRFVFVSHLVQASWLALLIYLAFFKVYELDYSFAIVSLSFFLMAQILKISSVISYGKEWSYHRSILISESDLSSGVYKLINHPHQIGSMIETFALPCFASFYLLGMVYGVIALFLFILRLKIEDKALFKSSQGDESALNLKSSNIN